MGNRDVDGAIEWLAGKANPGQSWAGLCHSASRNAYKMPAYTAWPSVGQRRTVQDQNHLVQDDEFWSTVPRGAILYDRRDVWPHMGSRL